MKQRSRMCTTADIQVHVDAAILVQDEVADSICPFYVVCCETDARYQRSLTVILGLYTNGTSPR